MDWYNEGRFNELIWLGDSLYYLSKYNEAITCFDQAIQINPKHENSWYYKGRFNELIWLGKSLSKLERFEEAIKCYEESLKINPTYAK